MDTKCPACDAELDVEGVAGDTVDCPSCDTEFTLGEPPVRVVDKVPMPARRQRRSAPHDANAPPTMMILLLTAVVLIFALPGVIFLFDYVAEFIQDDRRNETFVCPSVRIPPPTGALNVGTKDRSLVVIVRGNRRFDVNGWFHNHR